MPWVATMPVSNGKPGYTGRPFESFGPANALARASACARERQPSVFSPAQTSDAGSKRHPIGSETMPSRRPSAASQAASRPSMTALRSASENARRAVRLSRRVERRHAVQHRRDPLVADPGEVRAHRRRADDDAVEVGRMALRHQHPLAPAGRAAHEVRARGGPAVVLREDLLREHGHAPDRLVGEVEARLLLRHEGRVEDLPAVAGVGGDDGEAAGERGIALPRPPSGGATVPFRPPPPWNRKRPFQSAGSASAKPMP